MLDIQDALDQYDGRVKDAMDRRLRPYFKSFNHKAMAVLAALRGDYSDLELHWVIEQAKLKSKSPKGVGGLVLSMLQRGQRPDLKAPGAHKAFYPAAIEHLRHALDRLGLGREEEHAGLIDRLVRCWAPVTDNLLRHAYPGASAEDLLEWCLAQGNERGPVDPGCGKPGVIMNVLKSQMGKIADDWEAAVASCSPGEPPAFALPVQRELLIAGIGSILTGNPDLDSVLGPETDPWPPGKRTKMLLAKQAECEAAEKQMRDTGLAPNGTPYPVVRIRRSLERLKTCEPHMVDSNRMSLESALGEMKAGNGAVDSGGRSRALSEEWMQTISQEISEVFRGLVDRGLVERDEAPQTKSPVQAEIKPAAEPVMGLPSNDQDALNATIASLEDTTTAAEPGAVNRGGMNPPRPILGACEE